MNRRPHPTPAPRRSPAFAPVALLVLMLSACGGGTPDGAAREGALAVTSSLAVALPQQADPMFDGLVIPADAPTRGMWSGVQPWPMNAIHAVVLPDGKVLSYGAPKDTDAQDGRTFDVWTPSLGFTAAGHATSYEAGRVNSFCSTATYVSDGRLLVSGGNTPRGSSLFDTVTQGIVTDASTLADDRWYATMITLPDGRALVVGGIDPYTEGMVSNPDAAIQNGQVSMTPEVYTPGTGWRSLTGAQSRDAFGPDYLRASYPRAWVAPDGRVFGLSAETMWYLDPAANAGAGALAVAGRFKTPASSAAPVNVGATSTAVMFAPGRILQLGGNGYFNGDGLPASNMATVIDINGGAPVLTETARMAFARRYPNAVVLPDGQVVVTGGTRVGNNGGTDAVFAAELWNPATGTWTTGASAARIRVYHSNAVLMPNGTVLSLGGGTPGPQYNQNAEVYYPPNLFRSVGGVAQLAPRPVMTGLNARSFAPGATLQVEMADSAAIGALVLIANSSATHSFNTAQRRIPLSFTQTGDRLSALLPADARLAPPGHYQVFAVDANGVPSKAAVIAIGMGSSPLPPELPRNQPLLLGSVSQPSAAIGTDAAGLGILQTLSATPTPAELATAQFTVRDGLANAACVSLELTARPGQWLRHQGYRLKLGTDDGSALFRDDATFCPEAGLAGRGLTLRSKNYPAYTVHHRNGEAWIDPVLADAAFAADASFVVRNAGATPLPSVTAIDATPQVRGSTVRYAPGLDAAGLEFSWDFGDGSGATAYAATSDMTHTFSQTGVFSVALTTRNSAGQASTYRFAQAVYAPPTTTPARASGPMLLEQRPAGARLWVVNADNQSVSVFDTATQGRIAEITVGSSPRTLALAPNGQVWVVNRDSATISVIEPTTLAIARSIALPRASQPHGIVFAPSGAGAYVTLEASGQLLRLDAATGAQTGAWATGPTPRHLSISGDSARLLVSRFVTPALPGEGTATVSTTVAGLPVGAEVLAFRTSDMALTSTIVLRHSDRSDNEIQGSGIPNYLGPAVISPSGATAWVPSKQDNIRRGTLRNGLGLDFQNTVRAISSRIDLATLAEVPEARIDHDNASLASAAAYDPTGAYLFVALETARQVAVVDAARGAELFRLEVGLAPQGLAVSADGLRVYVHNFMARSVSVIDMTPLMRRGEFRGTLLATAASVGTERLAPAVLRGKQLFHDARDPRLARDSYMSCASCHHDATHDGRTWDFTGFGEGLRNTPSLRGRAGLAHGRLHWSANFDEVQDFEGQIRAFAGGTGLMTDAQFATGTRSQPLGDAKAGLSTDLDALAAYLGSLNEMPLASGRTSAGALTTAALNGRTLFRDRACATCHGGASFAASGALLVDIGTLKTSSGKRLGGPLPGVDVPTLRDLAGTAPYGHDGALPTLDAAVSAHRGTSLTSAQLADLSAYLAQIGREEPMATVSLPASTTSCAGEGGTCTLPSGTLATVYYGAGSAWTSRSAVAGSIACTNASFGDPVPGTVKACRYVAMTRCAAENGNCVVPAGTAPTLYYGANGRFHARAAVSGTLACNNAGFGDPIPGTAKACWLRR